MAMMDRALSRQAAHGGGDGVGLGADDDLDGGFAGADDAVGAGGFQGGLVDDGGVADGQPQPGGAAVDGAQVAGAAQGCAEGPGGLLQAVVFGCRGRWGCLAVIGAYGFSSRGLDVEAQDQEAEQAIIDGEGEDAHDEEDPGAVGHGQA